MFKIGTDILELDRLDKINDGFVKHVLSKEEIDVYNNYSEIRKKEYLGGRFAAKEAIIKCLSGIEIPNMRDIIILNNNEGKPIVRYKDYEINLSISNEEHYAISTAILEYK